MMDQEQLRDLTESYLKSVIAEASASLGADFDAFAPFGELGIDSFRVLKIIKALEADFGTLPKSLLFENFNINDLANYFVKKHEGTLSKKFGKGNGNGSNGKKTKPAARAERTHTMDVPSAPPVLAVQQAAPILILEKEAYAHPELGELVRTLFNRHRIEGSVSRGTRKIAPNLFIGSARRGYFNYARSGNVILVYAYTGPVDYFQAIADEMYRHCAAKGFQLNFLAGEALPPIGGVQFSATPFGVLQRIVNLKEFHLDGGPMRRLRYQVTKFLKAGPCRTEEYRCGSSRETAEQIADIIDRWCASRTMVNPLVHDFKAEILAGTLAPEHRVFVTYLDDVLQNAILITSMENGYLMDLEFYPPEMPLGGLEFTVVRMIERLVEEGCDVLSLGGTYGCKLELSASADPEIDKILDELRERNVFNDEGNLQFKNKFRPENHTVFLCRPVGAGNPGNVIDIIMMIADPEKLQTSDAENHNYSDKPAAVHAETVARVEATSTAARLPQGDRARTLAECGFNPLNIPAAQVDVDLKTDSWAQLEMPAIDAQMAHLHRNLQQPVVLDEALRAVFPFAHFMLTGSGQAAEHLFFKAWPKKGRVPQNLLFPSTIFHQIDNGFTPVEIPHPAVFQLRSEEAYKGNVAWEALEAELGRDPGAIALACIEVCDNAAGGSPVSLQHLRSVKARLAEHAIPLVIDATRIVENAQFLVERDPEDAGANVWTLVRELLSCADAVIGSLTKDFSVKTGGIIATNDAALFQRMQELADQEGTGLELIEKKAIALALQNRKQIGARVARRMDGVRRIWQALHDRRVPVAHPAGGHCVLIDVRQIPEFASLADPVASFLAWLYLNTGIRAGAHSAGMQKGTALNGLVRLAIPVGLKGEEIDGIIERLAAAFGQMVNIPEVVVERNARPGDVHASYELLQHHRPDGGSEPVSGEPESTGSVRRAPEQNASRRQDIAIVGMAGRYPGSKTLRELWDNLAQGRDCIAEIPADRYQWRVQHGSTAKYRGGFIDDVDKFDSLFFNISPREAEMLDPQERLFLEVAWEALEDAGYSPDTLALEDGSRNVGVFVGAVWAMYQMLGVEEKHAGNPSAPNSFLWSVANRVSYCLNLSGPSLTVDTACSSSLTALYLACEAIYAGRCSAAIVGGVNLDLHQARFDINSTGGALSPDGVCRSFGKGANGYVMGEGIGALYVKPLDRAIQDGDHVYGVIKSAVVNHGGRTSGYTVPNPKAQASLVTEALELANVPARTIGYVEAHGTGTALGDPVEITGLTNAFSADAVANQSCAIGSIKTNIGHAEAAAGVVSVTKVLLQMKQRQIAPSLHSSEPNEFIDFAGSPFYVPQQLQEWKEKEIDGVRVPLRAGISSFGAGGSNAHIILEAYEPAPRAAEEQPATGALIFPLSARTEDQLREAAFRLADFLRQSNDDLRDVAHTLQIGRKSFDHRLAVIAGTKDELLEKLTAFVTAKKSDDVIAGQAKNGEGVTRLLNRREKEEFVRILSESGDARKIASLWTDGLVSDWQGYAPNGARNRVSLPTYPFADKRHWAYQRTAVRRALQSSAAIHPMLDSNESTFERQLFKKTFTDRDFFIYDHHVSDIPTLPGVAYLELARKAGELAAGRKVRKIRNILWLSPIAVQSSVPKEVFVELKPSEALVRFEVFSTDDKGVKTLHSQGTLHYETLEEAAAAPETVDLTAIRSRTAKVTDGATVYPRFKSFGLNLGPSFQVLHDVYKGDAETLGILKLPELREADLQTMALPPSLLDGSLQAGVAGALSGATGQMFVPYSIGEVEILAPLVADCLSYVTDVKDDKKSSRVVKSNALIVDPAGRVLVKIRDSVGVPLGDIFKKADADEFSKLHYAYDWEPAPLAASATQSNPRLLIFDAEGTLRDRLQGEDVIVVEPGAAFAGSGDRYTVDPRSKDDFARLIGTLVEQKRTVDNICFAWPLAGCDSLDESLEQGVYPVLSLCQALVQHKLEASVQVLYVHPAKAEHEAIRGFINALRLEYPKLLCKAIEVGAEGVVEAVTGEIQARTQDTVAVRYEGQERWIKKLKAFELEETEGGASIRENGVYLITGGAGGLGLIFAEYLAKEHRAKLVLTGRSALSPEREAKLDELRNAGAEVVYLPADVANQDDIAKVVREATSRFGALHGVIHAAGVLRDSLVRNKTAEEMSAVFAPKLHGTLHLDEATRNEALDFFVTFSSLASVAGNAGQCDYSFANHFMDAFAARRTGPGKSLSINWSIWAEGGMKLDEPTAALFKKTLGISPLSAAAGLDAFVRGLASSRTQFAFLEGMQDKVEVAWGLRKKEPAPAAPAASVETAGDPAASQAVDDLRDRLLSDLSATVMEFLKLDEDDVATDKILMDLGFDSIGLATFANAINDKFQTDITPVLFFDYPTLDDVTRYLTTERLSEVRGFYGGSSSQTAPAAAAPVPVSVQPVYEDAKLEIKKGWNPAAVDGASAPRITGGGFAPEDRFVNEPIAIVGMSGVMPQSEDLDEFWANLCTSAEMVTLVPRDRWNWEDFYGDPLKEANKTNSKWGGFMKEVDKFDPLFFGVSPREAHMMDPQQRIFLETVWKTIEDSGQKVSDLSGTKTGLFVGAATNDYIEVLRDGGAALDGYSASGNSHSVLANRVSYLLNLHGPSAPIDTACSSSLVALHRAIESIHTGSCDMAIVGGIQVMLTPAAFISFGAAGMLSPDGKCKTFDKSANGYVRGEGSGAIFIKKLSAAVADGNHIYAVIRATAENHGGKVTTLTAPNSAKQAELLVEAYEKGHVDPATVGYIECHGTGTSLGDPIEIQALTKAFGELYKRHGKRPDTPHIGLSSVKTNIGHLETAAGIAGILKTLLAIRHKQIPANAHFEELNPYINLTGTPFYIADKLTPWVAPVGADGLPGPRRAGVSSFGFGGANAHIVLEEYIAPQKQAAKVDGPYVIVLSAKNAERLHDYVRSIAAFLRQEVELADLAYTLQVGRDEMPERLAVIASSKSELQEKLAAVLDGATPADCYRGNAASKQGKARLAELPSGAAIQGLSAMAEVWVFGGKIDWNVLYKAGKPKRIPAPTYPFARDRYWVEKGAAPSRPSHAAGAVEVLHPLVHRNTSTLQEQKFSSRFSGEEFFLADHVVQSQKILPGVAYMEIARAAGELAANAPVRVIRNLTWERPLVVDGDGRNVEVVLAPGKNEVKFTIRTGAGDPVTLCTGRLAYQTGDTGPAVLDVAAIKERCTEQVMTGKDLYPFLSSGGLELGRSFQIVQTIHATALESLAVLQLPEHLQDEAGDFWLHPALMDGSLHTAVGLIRQSGMDITLGLPYAVGEVQIFHPVRNVRYGYATWPADHPKSSREIPRATFHLLDENGKVLVRMKDFVSLPVNPPAATRAPESQLQSLAPVWSTVRFPAGSVPEPISLLLLGDDRTQLDWLNASFPGVQSVAPGADLDTEIANRSFDQLVWIAPDVSDDDLIAQQENGVLSVFRIIKSLQRLGYAGRKLQWTFVLNRTQHVVGGEPMQPAHAAVAGLAGSLAKEYPQWDLRVLDIDSPASVTARECFSLPWDKQGEVVAHRKGEWFRQKLAVLPTLPEASPAYRQNGVYVVIGGAGGVGEVWSRFMIEHYQANIVWIGRRELDDSIEKKINALAQLGPAPLYIAADATNAAALEQAGRKILDAYPAIHGVVHSAIVLQDQSLARMDEAVFRASLSAKLDVSVNVDRVFGAQDLDFLLFFSSIVSFVKSPGQANYAAGCTFKDSFAHDLQQRRPYPVKVMNWGYWGNVGVVADEVHKQTMAQMGIGSIEAEEGMAALRVLAGSDLHQMALIKTVNSQTPLGLDLSEAVAYHPPTAPGRPLQVRKSDEPVGALEAELPSAETNDLITEMLASSLVSLGLFRNGVRTLAGLSLDKQPAPYYERWLSASIRHLQQRNVLSGDLTLTREVRPFADLWTEWQNGRSSRATAAHIQAQVTLLETCLQALPAVLTGKVPATEVMFPSSSMHLVEGIYRGSAVVDRFNQILGETLIACIEQRLQDDPRREIRILEIGAGTGGTTAGLLPMLKRLRVAEYCYTDISRAFLMVAEKQFKPEMPALTTAIFDVTRPLAGQSIAAGGYDFAIAANVLHATPDIRETLRNTKATLKNGGVLLLNEVANWSLANHLTFGLLEGWWLPEDTAVRLPGSPGLATEKWQEILTEEGFESVLFPAEAIHRFGQQIVVAASNGWTRQRLVKEQRPAAPAASTAKAAAPAPRAAQIEQRSVDHVRQLLTEKLSEALRLDAGMIRGDAPFAEYGVDSIVGVSFVRTVSEGLQIEIEPSRLFEYSTVDDLAGYIQREFGKQIAAQLPAVESTPAPVRTAVEAPRAVDTLPASRFMTTEAFTPAEIQSHAAEDFGLEPIAVIGMSGRFSGSESLDAFWQNLEAGRNLVRQVTRWDAAECVMPGSSQAYCSEGSFVDSLDRFDPAFFGISAEEADCMDPQQRLFLEESWKALEDAGYGGKDVADKQCGVYVGCGSSNYDRLGSTGEQPAHAFWGNSQAVIPARVAYHLNLHGPAIAVDTACSSSLVTIHLACQSLWSRETEMALAGGVFLQATPGFFQVANRAGMLSPQGKCFSFDSRADGFVPGEGVGVIVLKRLRDAVRDGDSIHGVIAGSGVNQDGRSNGLIAPNGRAQEQLERSVYERFRINPETIQVVEAHATGTVLGDSIEYAAISRAFREYTDKKRFCALGTVKTNIGHAATAAGVAGVLKLLLSLRHRRIAPSLHFEKGNPAIDLESGPFYVNTDAREWTVEAGHVRRAAISAFGFSGTNAHLILEEAPAIERTSVQSPGYLVVLSARTADQLQQQARNLLELVERTSDLPMNDLSFTLLAGRTHWGHRLSCVVRDREELARLLGRWLESGAANGVFTSEIREGRIREVVSLRNFGNHCIRECANSSDAATYSEQLATIADLYLQGYALEFQALFPQGSRRIPLPTYPFARERHWIEAAPVAVRRPTPAMRVVSAPVSRPRPAASPARSQGATFTGAEGDLFAWLLNGLSETAGEILGLDAGELALDKVLLDLGFDSVGLQTFAHAINEKYHLNITPVLFFDHPSLREIAKHLAADRRSELLRLDRSTTAAPPETDPVEVRFHEESSPVISTPPASREGRVAGEPIAIVGISGVMPQSDDLDEFWENLKSAKDMVTVIPPDRWSWEDYYGDPFKEPNKSNSKWGGFMREIDKFDPLFFGISPREALVMDPQQRIFLQHVWKAIEDSGIRPSDLSGTRTGVFVGVAADDYIEVLRGLNFVLDGYSASGNSHAVLANRISFLLNLRGPSAPIDTACSSSLVALHRAVESIHAGSSDMAIVGGVQVMLSPAAYVAFGTAGMLSSDGKCKTFDKRANGYVRGEGCGAIVLKPLSLAEADGNPIYAVIRATAENHGGRVTTMTAPNSSAQAALLIEAYEKAQIDPATVGYIECHGTGTSLGDPIEIQALTTAFSELYERRNQAPRTAHCGLSSVKTNIGHLETAAGIAGVLKALLAIKHRQIPANVHFEELNPYINLAGTPFYIADKLTPWPAAMEEDGSPAPRRAGVSSFGFGGANAHVVLEEYVPRTGERTAGEQGPQLIVLSAKTANRLEAYARSMQAYLEKGDVELSAFAYTLQAGREEMPERLAFVASSAAEASRTLAEFLAGTPSAGVYRSTTRRDTDAEAGEPPLRSLIEQRELSKLAELWVSGAKIDWTLLHPEALPRLVSLPTYPFAREQYWPARTEGRGTEVTRRQSPTAAAVLHPLVHRNVSTLEEQKFASRFSGDEFFFDDHRVETRKMLPGVAYLEMARAAGDLSAGTNVRVLRNVTWERPLVAERDGLEVEVSLVPVKNAVRFAIKTAGKDGAIVHCTGKLAYSCDASAPSPLDVAAIRARCAEAFASAEELYGPLRSDAGLKLGRSFQIVQKMYASDSESLTILRMPEHLIEDAGRFGLHPALMEGSLHTGIGLVEGNRSDMPLMLPFSVGEVQIFHPLNDLRYGYATWSGDRPADRTSNRKVDVHLLDGNGTVLVRIKDFVLRPVPRSATTVIARKSADPIEAPAEREEIAAELHTAVPVWNPLHLDSRKPIALPESAGIVLLGDDDAQLDWLRKTCPSARSLPLAPAASIDSLTETLADCGFEQLLWIAPDVTRFENDERIVDSQGEGVLALFRIAKALLQAGYASKPLQWTIVTGRTQQVTLADPIQPTHAAVVGLIGSLAKECPHWNLRLLDLDSLESVSAQECLSLPWDEKGNVLAHRDREWFQQGLARMESRPDAAPLYRRNGVYVVIGGAGGVGEVWSRFMIERHQARIVWIGRREKNADIEAKIEALGRLGTAPLYIAADATDREALARARETVLQTYPAIHGVVHSAIVLQDQAIARMDETVFAASLSAKVDVSVNMDRVFGEHELDFMLFFSSMVSFVKSAGQSNYSAGCTFKDAFAHKLQRERAYPVKVMNWGYWGGVGIVADEAHNRLMAQMGIASIEPEEGMASLEALMSSSVGQIALIKTGNRKAADGLGLSETVSRHSEMAPDILPEAQQTLAGRAPVASIAALEEKVPVAETTELITEILASSLRSMGLYDGRACRIADVASGKQPAAFYERWLASTTRYLRQQGWLGDDLTFQREVRGLADLWTAWEAQRPASSSDANLQANAALVEVCLKALPDVLTGRQTATDVMFPSSSMRLVEGVYRGNALADYFNDVLGETLISCLERRVQVDGSGIRIVEIGAGTGGTTAKLLPLLQKFPIEEYCYTDLSKAFLMHAEKHYRPQLPVLTTAILDISRPLAPQSIPAGRYDFAIAANVLHATPDIRQTVRNAKATLKNRGILLLNEVSAWSLFSHVTFGLLEGWWLHEDSAVRLPGSPGVAPEDWRKILEEEGFESIVFPAVEAHRFGQQIIAASSNGWVRQQVAKSVAAAPSAAVERAGTKSVDAAVVREKRPAAAAIDQDVRRIITDTLSEALKLDPSLIRNDDPFADYGVDSIIGVNVVRTINETLQIELETTKLFEYTTVNQLAQYVQTEFGDQIAGRVVRAEEDSRTIAAPVEPAASHAEAAPGGRFMTRELLPEAADEFDGDIRSARETRQVPIAIIGMSGRFAESESLDELWQNLIAGKDLVRKVSRWPEDECVLPELAGTPHCNAGSFIDSIDRFDPAFFRISAPEAKYMDPQQRIFLEEAWNALEDAGYAGGSVSEKQCGVYVGCGNSGYGNLFGTNRPPHAFWGNSDSIIPTRIAYYLNLQGPAIAVNTACSSSLVAIHLACQSLWSRETEMALAGGVFLQTTAEFYRVTNHAGMLAPDGKCRSFDARANGFVPGEGAGVVVLKRLRDALADGDHIHGVIVGTGINQDGSSNGLIAPNGRAQERLERSVYEHFDIDPGTIQVVEAHGTGTVFGDSIELGALSRAFREYTDRKQFCAIGTIKTNIGHSAMAAGVAGLLKILLSLKHRQIPPSLHFEQANPAIDFKSSPFYVNTQARDWTVEDDRKRRAAISAFGFNGTNAHLVLEEAPSIERPSIESPGHLAVLSARTPEQLQQQVRNLLALVKRTPDLPMNDLSFTLLVARMHFEHRVACVARNQKELAQRLQQWLETGTATGVYASEPGAGKGREHLPLEKLGNRCIRDCRQATGAEYLENLAAIGDLYAQGYSLEYQALFPNGSRKMPLPTYPFARDRHWVDDAAPAAAPRPVVHSEAGLLQLLPTEPVLQAEWLFSNGEPGEGDSMGAVEKIELFLRQEIALRLEKAVRLIPTDQSYSDLGLTSLAGTDLIHNTNLLLGADLSPSVLFEYTDIRSLAAYLAAMYPARIDAIAVLRRNGDPAPPAETPALPGVTLTPGPRIAVSSRPSPALPPPSDSDDILEKLLWQETSSDDRYEKLEF